MKIVTQELLDSYLKNDWVLEKLQTPAALSDDSFTIQRWLKDTPPKRAVFEQVYGDLFKDGPRKSVLDVGGGFCALTRELAKNHDYDLLEISAHDAADKIHAVESDIGRPFFIESEWSAYTPQRSYDIIIANDLFPNVDQRLSLFLERYLPFAKEMRLSLTFYNTPRTYPTKRINADEILYMLAYDGAHTALALEKYAGQIGVDKLAMLKDTTISVYPNGRHVALVTLKNNT